MAGERTLVPSDAEERPRALGYIRNIEIVVDPHVPLTRQESDGSVVDILCWRINGRLHVNPGRWRTLHEWLASFLECRRLRDLDRWADDGGRA